MRIRTLQRRHFRELLALERQADEALDVPFATAVEVLESDLAELPAEALAAEHQGEIEDAARQALGVFSRQGRVIMAAEAAGAIAAGIRQELAEIALQEGRWGDADRAKAIAALEVKPPAIAPVQRKALYNPFRAVFEELQDRIMLGSVADAIQEAIASGENLRDAAARLVGKIKGERWQLTRIARTEIGNAMNQGHAAAIDEVASRYPRMGLKQQWSAYLDDVTSAICRALHGQVQEAGKPFAALGESHARPPARPNCRSRLNSWAPHWKDALQPRTEAQIAADEAEWLATRQREREAARAARQKERAAKKKPRGKKGHAPATFAHYLHTLTGREACCSGHP